MPDSAREAAVLEHHRSFPFAATVLRALTVSLLLAALGSSMGHASSDANASVGEGIYQRGVTGSGAPLQAFREGGARMAGADVACINCHRRSGFGATEGRIVIPPITGRYLLRPGAASTADRSLPYVETMRLNRDPPYTEATLARAIREGIDADGRPLNYLMPHFALSDSDMAALIGYLKDLDRPNSPGVTDTVLHFATIITPDADPIKRRGMLDVITHYFADRNAVQFARTPPLRASSKMAWARRMFKPSRHWGLHVWELTGPANTWGAQLTRHFAEEPVLAVISGLGGKDWDPVQAFCEHESVPCLFPNVEVPPAQADRDFYSVYFSKGVLLEAALIANRILERADGGAAKVVQQIYRAGDNGEAGAKALDRALTGHGITTHHHVLARGELGQGVADAVAEAAGGDVLVLWLRPADIAALGNAPATPSVVFMSGLMGGLEVSPLPGSWRSRTHLAYLFDLPTQRRVPVDYALGWFRIRHIAIVDEQVQADTYLACGLLSETLQHMADTFVPDYLVERVQDMLDHRIITGYYPHLALAPGQRFASKGGYLVHFADAQGQRLVADSGWLVP
jgi:hypothetical protein